MIYNLVQNLCEPLIKNIGGVADTGGKMPIVYLTQWTLVGNSEVKGILSSWEISGNSVVQGTSIISCGDLGLDEKYHVKISNGEDTYDISVIEPLRKVNNDVDTIKPIDNLDTLAIDSVYEIDSAEFSKLILDAEDHILYGLRWDGTEYTPDLTSSTITIGGVVYNAQVVVDVVINGSKGKALVTRNIKAKSTSVIDTISEVTNAEFKKLILDAEDHILYGIYWDDTEFTPDLSGSTITIDGVEYGTQLVVDITKSATDTSDIELLYVLDNPISEIVDAPQIMASSTDTYTSANTIPYSAFTYTKNMEIWSCGEYNATDGKYHILVQPQGGSIADIALTEPLRKVNDVADTIEFPSTTEGKALVTRNIARELLKNLSWSKSPTGVTGKYRSSSTTLKYSIKAIDSNNKKGNLLCAIYDTIAASQIWNTVEGIAIEVSNNTLSIFDENYTLVDDIDALIASWGNAELIYELATPTTELVDAPQIAEADSYSCVISQGGKAVSWSNFETE